MRYVLLLCALISFTSIAENLLVPLDIYANKPEISLMTISPDGTRIAYKTIQNERDVLLIKDIKTGEMLGGVVLDGINAQQTYFIDNFRVIMRAFEYKKVIGFRNRNNHSAAFIYDLRSKETRQILIAGHGIYTGQTNIGAIVGLSLDKQYAYMPAYYSASKGVSINNFGEGPVYTLMKVNLKSKRKPRQLRIGTHDAIDFFIDENGEPLARERYDQKEAQHRVQSYIDGKWIDIFSEKTAFIHRSFVGLTPDKKALVMTMTGENGRRQYFTMSLKDGTVSEPIFSRDDADVEEVFTDLQRVVYGVKYSGFKSSYAFFDDKLTKTFAAIQNALPENNFTMVDHTSDWKNIIFKLEGGEQGGEYLTFANNGFSFLASSRPNVSAAIVNPVKEYNYNARDGYEIPTLLTYPKASLGKKQKLPAVVMPHGGPEAYDRIQFDWLAQYLASRGILVIQPQFRGSEGFGVAHLQAGRGEWGQKIQDDITDSVNALSKEGVIDPERVCIMGWSYGGYAALAGATMTPDLYQCAISINGLSDIEEMLDFEKSEYGENSSTYRYWQEVINRKDLDAEFLKSISPINHVEKVKIPVLLIYGSRDKVVPPEQSEDFYDALKDAKKDVELLRIKDEPHSFLRNESRLKTLTAIDTFLNKHLL
jgi:dipeptidyl aminopeptidase/acylaminoacyl peptidase